MVKHTKRPQFRLPVTFHQTFIPERAHLSALLTFAASEKDGTDQEISVETGIPTGQSSGKVPAMVDYGRGMGLIQRTRLKESGRQRLALTGFGRTVLLEDRNLSEELTQWLAHLMLCRPQGGAEVWYLTFGRSTDVLGMTFAEDALTHYLTGMIGKRKRSPIGPMIGMYAEAAAFKKAGALTQTNTILQRLPAPVLSGFANGYAALLLAFWEVFFPKERQVTITDFEAATYFQHVCGWNDRQYAQILDLLEQRGALTLDKQMHPWVLVRRAESHKFWRSLYDELA